MTEPASACRSKGAGVLLSRTPSAAQQDQPGPGEGEVQAASDEGDDQPRPVVQHPEVVDRERRERDGHHGRRDGRLSAVLVQELPAVPLLPEQLHQRAAGP